MRVIAAIILSLIRLVNIVLHSGGCFLLITQYRNGVDTPQQLFLINLSFTELLQNITTFFMTPIHKMVDVSDISFHDIDVFQEYLVIVIETTIWFMYYVSMTLITVDRLLAICLNLKYPVYCSVRKAKRALLSSWVFSVTLFVVVVVLYSLDITDYYPYIWYVYITFDFAFVILAMVCYIFIFRQFSKTREQPSMRAQRRESLFRLFRRSRFYLSVCLITSFLCLKVTADLLLFFLNVVCQIGSADSDMITFVMWALSDSVDAWIYIYMETSVRKLFLRRFRSLKCCMVTTVEPNRRDNQSGGSQELESRM